MLVIKRQRGSRRVTPIKMRKALRTNIRPEKVEKYRPERPVLPLRGRTLRRNTYWYKSLLFGADKVVCGICQELITDLSELTIDHIVPLSRGGTNFPENLQPAHQSCNWSKGSKLMDEL